MDPHLAFEYCLKCGSEFSTRDEKQLSCSKCGYKHYISPVLAVGLLPTNKNTELLLVTRKKEPFKGFLDVLGGFAEINETLEQAAIRETKEELGINISQKDLKYFASFYERYEFQNISYYTLTTLFEISFDKFSKFKPSDDISDAQFYDYRNIDFDRVSFSNMKKTLKKFISHLEKNNN